jgi:transposase
VPVAVSDLCDEYQLQPKVFYEWHKLFFENGAAAVGRDERSRKRSEEARIQQLEVKLRRKHEVLSELMEEHVGVRQRFVLFGAIRTEAMSISRRPIRAGVCPGPDHSDRIY